MAFVVYLPDEYIDGLSLEDYLRIVEEVDVKVLVEDKEIEVILV